MGVQGRKRREAEERRKLDVQADEQKIESPAPKNGPRHLSALTRIDIKCEKCGKELCLREEVDWADVVCCGCGEKGKFRFA